MRPPTYMSVLTAVFLSHITLTASFTITSPISKSFLLPQSTSVTTTTTITTTSISKSTRLNAANQPQPQPPTKLATQKDIIDFGETTGVILSLSTLGPGYRAIARAKHNTTQIIGYCEGFIRPGGNILHLDKMEVFKKALVTAREENPDFKSGGTVFGVGLLLGCLCLCHGLENNCKIAEFLAIDDNDYQHKRLVRHYKRLGLNVIRYVGEDISNIPDRLIWGGVGTLMNAKIVTLLEKWSPTFLQIQTKEE